MTSDDRASPTKALRSLPEQLLLGFGVLFGGVLVFLTPPFQAPDEQVHFYRAYQVSSGGLVAEKRGMESGGQLPVSLPAVARPFLELRFEKDRTTSVAQITRALEVPLERSQSRFVSFESSAVYSPVPYLPQVVGIAFGKLFDLPPIALLYLGRLANLAASVLVLLAALRAAPVFAWVLLLLALMPMMVFQMASLSADGLTNALAFWFVGLVLQLLVAPGSVDRRALATLAAVSVALSLSKQAYALLILLLLAVPPRAFGNRRGHLLAFGSICAINALALGIWALLTRDVVVPPSWVPGADPAGQVRWILDYPRSFTARLLERLTPDRLAGHLDHLVGRRLGWWDTILPYSFIAAYQAVLVGAAALDSRDDVRMGAGFRILCLVVALATYLAISTMVFIYGNRVGWPHIKGLQGRYFIPLAPLLLLPLYNRTLRRWLQASVAKPAALRRLGAAAVVGFLLVSAGITVATIQARYYG